MAGRLHGQVAGRLVELPPHRRGRTTEEPADLRRARRLFVEPPGIGAYGRGRQLGLERDSVAIDDGDKHAPGVSSTPRRSAETYLSTSARCFGQKVRKSFGSIRQ